LFAVDIGFAITQARQWLFKVRRMKVFGVAPADSEPPAGVQLFGSKREEGFEDLLQRQVTVSLLLLDASTLAKRARSSFRSSAHSVLRPRQQMAKDEFGVEIGDEAFAG
jgi:hypothetical protein